MDVCARLRRILGMKKIGHAGTLDPMAEGVLPVALGLATKDVDKVGAEGKVYEAGMLLGTETDTEDITGSVLRQYEGSWPGETAIREAILSFEGGYDQMTPMYSARKVNGKKLYEYARAGREVERKTKHIEISSMEILEIQPPHVRFRASCSKGTYIRTLCKDIGERLGCGACMESLLRLSVGSYSADSALRLAEVEKKAAEGALDSDLRIEAPTAVALGKFDGTHMGHQFLLKELKKTAQEMHLRTMVLILKFGNTGILTDAEHRQKFYDLGIDYVIELPFTEELRSMSARDFLEKLLIGRYRMKAIVAGQDVSFGYAKQGNADYLHEHEAEYGYTVKLIDKIKIDFATEENGEGKNIHRQDYEGSEDTAEKGEQEISSTLLRKELAKGDMLHVTRLLGSPYAISGTVIHGRRLGSGSLRLPTINIPVPETILLPPKGVYAVTVRLADEKGSFEKSRPMRGIANLGERPTVPVKGDEKRQVLLEAHVFSENGDWYDRPARVELRYYIRPEEKFADMEALKTHLQEEDIPAAERFFNEKSIESSI